MIKKLLPVLSITSIGAASAALVSPTGITVFHQGDSLAGDGSMLRVVDGSGMSKPDADDPSTWTNNSTAWQDDWQGFAPPSPNTTWAILDLGSPTADLDQMFLWNVQENAPGNQTNRGMADFNIWYSNSPTSAPPAPGGTVTPYDFNSGGWTQLGGTNNLPVGTGIGDAGAAFDISGASGAQYIGIEMLTNHGAGDRTGFGEVAFTSNPIPEPTSMALLLLGGLGILRRRR